MIIAIISDIHDNLANLEKFLQYSQKNKVKKIICCGDVVNFTTLEYLLNNFKNNVYLINGNNDNFTLEDEKKFSNLKFLGRYGVFELEKIKIGLCHEPFFINKILEQKEKPLVIFYGHTHKPWIEDKNNIKLINPGTLGGVFNKPSFTIWDIKNKKLDLQLVDELY